MSLPVAWVDRIFDKLSLIYGARFARAWQDVKIADVKTDWAFELAGFEKYPEAIAYALQHLPSDYPPNVLEFRNICRKMPEAAPLMVEGPPIDPALAQAVLKKLRPIVESKKKENSKEWAHRILARHAAGERITYTVHKFAKQALGLEP